MGRTWKGELFSRSLIILEINLISLHQIPDPTAVKPDDWDKQPQISDPAAVKPENWLDDEEDMISGETKIL